LALLLAIGVPIYFVMTPIAAALLLVSHFSLAALDEAEAIGQEAFELDGADFRAVLFLLAALLGVLIVVERTLHTVGGAVEEIDR
jgi:hypothetical protein